MKKNLPKNILRTKYKCSRCGKTVFPFGMSDSKGVSRLMKEKHICWECAYWEIFLQDHPPNLEVIGNNCYQVFPFIDKEKLRVEQILGSKGKTYYILKKNGECIRSNDVWWINTIPWQYQSQFPPTAWWVNKKFWESMERSKHKCKAVGCMDRYHCYRYQYQLEFDKEPYNHVPRSWIVGSEHCPAFLPLTDIKYYDEYVKPEDIIDESSV